MLFRNAFLTLIAILAIVGSLLIGAIGVYVGIFMYTGAPYAIPSNGNSASGIAMIAGSVLIPIATFGGIVFLAVRRNTQLPRS